MAGVCVVGAGYVGLATAVCLAELGHSVSCVEIEQRRLSLLRHGCAPIREPGLEEALKRLSRAARLRFTGSHTDALAGVSFTVLAVNTPAGSRGETDTSFVEDALHAIGNHIPRGSVLLLKSTVPPGTGDAIAAKMAPRAVDVVSNPEFLRQGSALEDFMRPDRIVIGGDSEAAMRAVQRLYSGIRAPVYYCSRRSAEMAKYTANAFLAARISLINEVAGICESTGADINEVSAIIGADRRIGPAFLGAGLGWGGSCLPKDLTALIDTASRYGRSHDMLEAVYRVNIGQRELACRHLALAGVGREDPSVAVLGLAFKPNTGDIRGSPALEIIAHLLEDGFRVTAHDPAAIDEAKSALPNIRYCSDAYSAARGSDAVLLATEWETYRTLDWNRIRRLMRGNTIVDGRNLLDGSGLTEAGFNYVAFGKPVANRSKGDAERVRPIAEPVAAGGGSNGNSATRATEKQR